MADHDNYRLIIDHTLHARVVITSLGRILIADTHGDVDLLQQPL